MNPSNVFAGAFVDRLGERRRDAAWLDAATTDANAQYLPVQVEKCLVAGDPPRLLALTRERLQHAGSVVESPVFLGMFRGAPTFATEVADDTAGQLAGLGEFQDLRFLGSVLPPDEANLAAHARALVTWHRAQAHCGSCGTRSHAIDGGNARLCPDPACGRTTFPRVDPAIIVLVVDGDRCLLGRQPGWPEGRYSAIAGFVEAGESLEDSVRREVFEETNVRVCDIRYHSSQPWPFPSSLMIGFIAEAASEQIVLNDRELEDAGWFSRRELKAGYPRLPYRISIARRLIDGWLDADDAAEDN